MKALILAALIATTPTVDTQQLVACKRVGDYSGQVYYFEIWCPAGYYPA